MTSIETKYEVWKNKLLDMGKRNRLLNYKDTARSSIKIEYPDCSTLWNQFVKEEIPLIFPLVLDEDGEDESEYASNVETNKSFADLQKALRNIRSKAKTAIEEQGVNVLYLSFGFLNWTESENSDQILSSPLILVPASLTVDSIKSPYILKLREDEILLNPSLIYKLENDFGISLPPFDESDDIEDFLENVRKKTLLKGWSVTDDVGLSLLSFLKINMYSDLNNQKDSIISNPIVRAIGGDTTAIARVPEDINDYDFDKHEKPIDLFQVVDADASQQDAILMAKKGISFVLQGPPGTGKSQTITNIIAESLADGKKVLFVSEKMAALDVVHHRLSNSGLNDFCLVLHSHKANKKDILDQLRDVLDLSHKKATLSEEAYQKLGALQEDKIKLNNYATQIYQPITPLGKSIYEANGIIANLADAEDFIFSIEDVRKCTTEQYNKYSYLLSQYADTIGKLSDDYKNNPWRGCNLQSVSNEFRHDASSHLASLLSNIRTATTELTDTLSRLHLDLPCTLNMIDHLVDLLKCAEDAYSIPADWVLSGETCPTADEIKKFSVLKERFVRLSDQLEPKYLAIHENDSSMPISNVVQLSSHNLLLSEKEKLSNYLSSTSPYSYWLNRKELDIKNYIDEAKSIATLINTQKAWLLQTYEPTVFGIDYESILTRIKTEYTSFTKFFKKTYRQDKKSILAHHKNVVKKISDEDMYSVVKTLHDINNERKWYEDNQELLRIFFGEVFSEDTNYSIYEKHFGAFVATNSALALLDEMLLTHADIDNEESALHTRYKFLYTGILTNWDMVHQALNWAIAFKRKLSNINASDSFIKSVCEDQDFIKTCLQSKETLEQLKQRLSADYQWFTSKFDNPDEFDHVPFSELENRFSKCANGLALLEEWIDYSSARANCIEHGLEDFICVIEANSIPTKTILPVFKKRFFRLWLDAVLPEHPAVLNFRRKTQEATITEFCALDKIQFEIAKARIRSKLINALPSLEHITDGLDEMSVLKRELNKQRRIMPIRKLFKEIPNLLLTLKPCLMMSPLSVSLFLEAETYKFDIVIFDEASQVCTENAIGAISRAKQVIIAGDSKQLPPTNFFQAAVSENDFDTLEDDDFNDSDAYESVLDEASLLPERTLRWHYRSRHESLIAFSNAKIYKNSLTTFPSNIEKASNYGVEYVFVPNGFYDRGGKKGNVNEAIKVADLVFKHFREEPSRSLGVIAFGEAQQQAIETVIRERRLQNQEFEHFFAEDVNEAFFVKNLENVQGDERDTIIFSIGYAKDNAGIFRMNFGPLSKSGGERRLNVAITRAKFNVKLVGSIMPTDIAIDKINSEGPKLLRSYIDFAINGPSVLDRETSESDTIEHDSPFEEAVYNFLDKKGYKLATQVGCSGYRIDMAVKHPVLSGIYVLGIECDGAAYHSARTARERDRLRQDVLENMGWKIHRIWSTDWIKDPIAEGNKLITAIEDAIASYGAETSFVSNNSNASENAGAFVSMEEKDISLQFSENRYEFEEAQTPDFSSLPRDSSGYLELTDCIIEVVQKEYPIHYELLCQRIAPLYGNEKATCRIRNEVDSGLKKLGRQIVRKDDFIFPSNYDTIPVRLPNSRKIQHIYIEELAEAMLRILATCVGTTSKALKAEVTRVYGFARAGQNISLAMSDALDFLLKTEKIEEIGGKLRIKS